MNIKFLFLVLISFSILFVSCEADIKLNNISDEVSLHPGLIIPIGGANVSLGQIIMHNDLTGRFQIGEDAEINYLRFDTSEIKFSSVNFLQNSIELKSDIHILPTGNFSLLPNTSFPAIITNDFISLGINSNINGDQIDSIRVKSATISVKINASPDLGTIQPKDLKFTIMFPNGKIRMLDGSSSTISLTPLGFGIVNDINISNFMLSTSGDVSGIPIQIQVDLKSANSTVPLGPASIITSTIKFTKLDYDVAYGNFKSTFNISKSFIQHLDIVKEIPNGSFKFTNPQVYISATSNIGTYLNFQIDYVKAFQSVNQNLKTAFASFNGNRSTFIPFREKPVIPGESINVKLRTLDKDWGETNQLFENDTETVPDIVEYKFSASVNSDLNSQTKTPSFITSDSKIKVVLKTVLPLNFAKGSYYEFKDSIPNVFILIANALNLFPYKSITSTALILNISNGLPVKATLSISLNDSLGNDLPTTFEKNYVIEAGKVDLNGLVQPGKETKQTVQISVTKDQLVILRRAKTMSYKVKVEGDNMNPNIHFTSSNRFDLKVGLFLKGDVITNFGTNTQK